MGSHRKKVSPLRNVAILVLGILIIVNAVIWGLALIVND